MWHFLVGSIYWIAIALFVLGYLIRLAFWPGNDKGAKSLRELGRFGLFIIVIISVMVCAFIEEIFEGIRTHEQNLHQLAQTHKDH
jgi:hypothetical protein